MDEDVVFQNSALYEHLQEAGFSCDDIAPETLSSVVDSVKHSLERDSHNEKQDTSEKEEYYPRKFEFSMKNFLLGMLRWLLGINAWRSEAREQQQQFAYELCEDILNTQVIDNEDFEFIDKFTGSIKDRYSDTNEDSIGEYFKHGTMFVVVLGYGIVRVVQIKHSGIGDIKTWSSDVMAVCLMVCILLPSVFKIVAVERLKQKLKKEKILFIKHLNELERIQILCRKSVRLVQETEVVNRGFTLSSAKPTMNDDSRQCPALRKSVFKCSRKLMLNTKHTARELMDICPLQDMLEGGPSYLCLLPIHEYGSCVNLELDSDELLEATDNYALSAVKGMVSLWQSHISEWLRIVSVYCLLYAHKPSSDFCQLFPLIATLQNEVTSTTTQLEYTYLLHKCQLGNEKESNNEKRRGKEEKISSQMKCVNISVNSLILHIKAAFNRLQKVHQKLDDLTEEDKSNELTLEVESELISELKVVKCNLDACQECWTESIKWVSKKKESPNIKTNYEKDKEKESPTLLTSKTPKIIPICEMGDPVILDQVFEAYTDPTEINSSETLNDISDDEKEIKKREANEAVKVLNELKSVITVRAEETRQREIKAMKRMKGETTDVEDNKHKEVKKDSKNISTENEQTTETEGQNAIPGIKDSAQDQYCDKTMTEQTQTDSTCSKSTEINETACSVLPVPEKLNDRSINNSEKECSASDKLDTTSLSVSDTHSSSVEHGSSLSLKQRLEKLHGNSIPFATNIANLAVAKSQQMASYNEDTFGDSDSS